MTDQCNAGNKKWLVRHVPVSIHFDLWSFNLYIAVWYQYDANVVGVAAVRDLFSTVHNEGANKGILVTTSTYGLEAYEFAKGKPLTRVEWE